MIDIRLLENTIILNESISDFFKKIIHWVTEYAKKFKNWISALLSKVLSILKKTEKINNNQSYIEAEVREYKNFNILQFTESIFKKLINYTNSSDLKTIEDIKNKFFNGDINKFIRNSIIKIDNTEKKKVKVSDYINGYDGLVKLDKEIKKIAQISENRIKSIMQLCKKENESDKNKILNMKNSLLLIPTITTALVNVALNIITDCNKISKMFKDQNKKDDDVNKLVRDTVAKKDKKGFIGALVGIIFSDRDFSTNDVIRSINYAKKNGLDIMESYDGKGLFYDKLKNSKNKDEKEDIFEEAVYAFRINPCKERYQDIKKIGRSIYK